MADATLDALLENLRSPDADVRRAAVATLSEVAASHVDDLVPLLTDADARFRFHILRTLLALGDGAIPALTHAIQCAEQPLRDHAAMAFARLPSAAALEALQQIMREPALLPANAALRALTVRGDVPAEDLWALVIQHPDAGCRRYGTAYLTNFRRFPEVPTLLSLLCTNDDGASKAAINALIEKGRTISLPHQVVTDPGLTMEQRYRTLEALCLVPELIARWARYDNVELRDIGACVLGGIPFLRPSDLLYNLQHDENEVVRSEARAVQEWRDLARPTAQDVRSQYLMKSAANPAPGRDLLRAGTTPTPAPAESAWRRWKSRWRRR